MCGCWSAIIRAPARMRALLVRIVLGLMGLWVASYYITIQTPPGKVGWRDDVVREGKTPDLYLVGS